MTQGINLNKAHNSMAMKQAVANRLSCAVSFAYLDVCSGYWQLPVDDKNSALDIQHPLGSISIYKAPLLYLTGPRNQPFEGVPVEIMVEDFLIHVHGEGQTDDDCKLCL